jgi:hypothetical protein
MPHYPADCLQWVHAAKVTTLWRNLSVVSSRLNLVMGKALVQRRECNVTDAQLRRLV